uniref:HECT-type E3 ubiquitin transferase n=1 Tax=Ascaris suum TaxID=6253 RepID=F1KTF0_ASCSU
MDGAHRVGRDNTHHLEPTAALKTAIGRYHRQLMEGCGRVCCANENCASSGKLPKLTSNEAAARAITCLRDKAPLCDPLPVPEQIESLNEERAKQLLKECRDSGDWIPMRRYLEHALSTRDVLLRSFVTPLFADKIAKTMEQTTDMNTPQFTCTDMQPGAPRKRRAHESQTQQVQHVEANTEHNNGTIPAREVQQGHQGESDAFGVGRETDMRRGGTSGRRISAQPTVAAQSGSSIEAAVSSHLLSTARSTSLTRSASDLGTSHTTASTQRSEHCSDCGWRNVLVEDKDAQTENMDMSDKEAGTKKIGAKSTVCEEDISVLAELRSGKSPTDMDAAKRCFDLLFRDSSDHENYLQVAMGAVAQLCNVIDFQLQYERAWEHNPGGVVHLVNLLFQLPFVQWFEFIDVGFTPLCKMCTNLGKEGQMAVASVWAQLEPKWLQDRVGMIQQAMTIRVLTVIDAVGSLPRFTDRIEPLPTAVQTLSILYKAVLLKAKRTSNNELPPELLHSHRRKRATFSPDAMDTSEYCTYGSGATTDGQQWHRPSPFLDALQAREGSLGDEEEERLAQLAEIDAWAVTKTCFPLTEFVNGTLSENFSVEDDFVAYKSFQNGHAFSVMPEYSFVVSLEAKQRFLIICNRIRQRSERRHALADAIAYGMMLEPYLRLTVRRDHVVRDALDGLAAVAFDNVSNFRKQLRVYFDGEQAVDEGGVSKEFYQLITQQLFCPDYGMFIANEKTGLYWFNSQCTFCDDEYGLIGLLFGLAIYNNVLVDVRFPTALYTKLLARPAGFDELAELDPDLYNGLKELLACEDDVENIYCYTFEISYKDAYGNVHNEELIPGGKNIAVNNENKKEFVAAYADFLLNGLVRRQFDAFSAGFCRVAGRGLLRRLCLPQEVEELVCGVLDLNFDILAQSTRYQNGFTETSQTIKDFWTVAKAMTNDEKKMLLQFITGSDRAPVGGLAKLEIVIARNGDDKMRLPTAHTCYNVMLLPDYANLEVTRERVFKAISYSRGFGLQ